MLLNPLLWEKVTVREKKAIYFGADFIPHVDLKKKVIGLIE